MKRFLTLSLILAMATSAMPQNYQKDFESFRKNQRAQFGKFVEDKQAEYDAYRKQINDEYASFMKQRWEAFIGKPSVQPQPQPEVTPVVYDEPKTEPTQPQPEPVIQEIPVQPDVVVVPTPTPAPEPIAPVQPKEDDKKATERVSINFYGTIVSVDFPQSDNFKLASLNETDLAEAWKQLSNSQYDVTLANCLSARKSLELCDWGYLELIKGITKKQYGASNEAVFMQAFLMTQSGYKIRLAKDAKQLYLLINSSFDLFDYGYYVINGQTYYAIDCEANELQICPAAVEKENALSLQIAKTQKLNEDLSEKRKLTSKKGVTTSSCVNKNEISFYNNYPSGFVNNDVTTTWAAYANTPLDPKIQAQLYPTFQKITKDMSQQDAVNIILNWVQTAFEYEYDDKVWGEDRTFFAAETLYYPYCDCEDRSVLFSRLIRDILHLPVVLLYYPGHLATAVGFTQDVQGDYLTYNNKKYVVCDPTYIGAPVGKTMPKMDNTQAKIVVLQ